MSVIPYGGSLEQVFAELERVDLLVRIQVARLRHSKRDDKFEGLYVSEQEIDEHLARPLGAPRWAGEPSPVVGAQLERLDALRRGLVARAEATRAAGLRLRLDELVAAFGLSDFDRDVVLLCLAPEVAPRYERLYAYLQDDVTRRRPGVDLVLELLRPALADKLAARARFAASAPLLRHNLVQLFDEPAHPCPTLLGRFLRLDPRVAAFLLDGDELAAELDGLVTRLSPRPAGSPGAAGDARARLAGRYDPREGLLVDLVGPAGSGKKSWARALCADLGLGLLVVDAPKLLGAGPPAEAARRLSMVAREAVLQQAAIYWEGLGELGEDDHAAAMGALLGSGSHPRGLTFVAGPRPWVVAERVPGLRFTRVELPRPGDQERLRLWQRELPAALPDDVAAELPALASKFRFTAGQVRAAVANARERAHWRAGEPALTVADLYAACRAQHSSKLGELARPIVPHYTWSDIVLPPDSLAQLREVCDRVRLRGRVHEEWGWSAKLSLGKGINVVFSGPSGTGKTMAAEILAHELGLDLYKIDLSGVVSKYIGETEKNLARIFAEAETSDAILFFDEADSLFGKRSEVKDAHDRYANIETSYLLQRMEEYQGLTILATNLRKNLDEAFVRRMAFALAFSLPEEAERLDIWRKVWPSAVPLDPALDLEFMARQFKLSGGNIKNIAVAATFLAASRGVPVSTAHLILGTRRELQKIGRMCVAADFGKYAALAE
ncbi:AAA family ATPase [Nannocystis exedens]|uniref:AAA family ATPase n=1 Tax=Nannocystis exedens TaxID=54 RepID=UPI000BB9FE26|nr:AAA family ATPase [Nannocystis exedens]PCC73785.1 ATP-dependent zinc metalloprotease FtsH [Nannocystis exedens]